MEIAYINTIGFNGTKLKIELSDKLKEKFKFECNKGEFYVVKKEPQYPKTYEECCKVLGSDPSKIIVLSNRKDVIHEENKHCYEMYNLYQLLICRDAYWKIAGDKMRLGEPWKPDFTIGSQERYGMYTTANKVEKDFCSVGDVNMILTFPTKEMRDVFYENFKELIEQCKELL